VVGSLHAAQQPAPPLEIVREEGVFLGRDPEFVHERVSRQPAPLIVENAALPSLSTGDRSSNPNTTDQATPGAQLPIAQGDSAESFGLTSIALRSQSDRASEANEPATTSEELEAVLVPRLYALPIAPPLQSNPSSAAPARLTQSPLSHPFAPQARAADDIEIRIGRIEVTAVQPAPPRAAPAKPPRRGPSLNDYLRRRDGRPS
jgi:hypothetical protein